MCTRVWPVWICQTISSDYVYVCICMCTTICVYIYVHVCVCVHIFVYVCMYVCMYQEEHAFGTRFACGDHGYVCMYVCMYVCTNLLLKNRWRAGNWPSIFLKPPVLLFCMSSRAIHACLHTYIYKRMHEKERTHICPQESNKVIHACIHIYISVHACIHTYMSVHVWMTV